MISPGLAGELEPFFVGFGWAFLGWFVLLNGGYLLLSLFSVLSLRRHGDRQLLSRLHSSHTGLMPPISVLVPAYNEQINITASVESLLQLDYPEFEIVVINDGSTDGTLDTLTDSFGLLPFPAAYWRQLACAEVRGIYRSARHPNLRVLDKTNGGKADALNAGINAARYPLFCAVDADSILQRDSLTRVVQPFLDDPDTIVAGGTIRIANGCRISGGYLVEAGMPSSALARFQIVEYLRAFLFGRLGWSPINAVLIVSGAFGLFSKRAVVAAGGYLTQTVGEDMELIVRLHRIHRRSGVRYRIVYIPDPICWTEAPETLAVLRRQRIRWQRGLAESLSLHRPLLFHPRSGSIGWLAFPFFALLELLGPAIEVFGYATVILGVLLGAVSPEALVTFVYVALALGILLSVTALLLEELSFRLYPQASHLVRLLIAAVAENLGYRQLITLWRFEGLVLWLMRTRRHWGTMTRSDVLGSSDRRAKR